jgi:hypothetical protein
MATVNKDFKIKSGLIVEGTTASVNGFDILTKKQADQDYIVGLIGGTATSANEANKVVKRDANGNFAAGTITADITGQVSDISNHDTADLAEGTNKYFTDARARDAISAGEGTTYNSTTGVLGVKLYGGQGLDVDSNNYLKIDRTAVDGWYDAAGSASAAQTAAEGYADDLINDASSSSTEVWSAYKTGTEIGLAQAAAEQHADDAVAALVNGAPDLLNTLNELAEALEDNPDIIGDLRDIAAGKQDTLTAGANIDITGATISVTGLDSADISDFNTAALSATAAAYDVAGAAATAEQNAIAHADALTTSDVAEGTEQYFTDARAKASAASLLVGATKTNITITGTGAGLTITAENGVADSTTSDLVEGSNLYFTNERAVDALEAVVPNFTSVDLNSVAKQVAANLSAPTAGIQTAHAFAKADYRSAEYLVKVAYGTHTEISKVLLTLDSSDNIAITEYGIVGTNGSASTISAGISGANVQLLVTTANNNSTVTVMGTLLK